MLEQQSRYPRLETQGHYSETELHALGNIFPCWRGKTQKGTYLHMLWSCEGWLNSGKEYVILPQYVYRSSLFVCLQMLILETYQKKLCNLAFRAVQYY